MKRICLISPGHLSTNPRLVKEALSLKYAGFEVTVIHGRFNQWGAENDVAIAREIGSTTAVPFGPVAASRVTYLRQNIIRHGAKLLVRTGRSCPTVVETSHHPIVQDIIAATLAQPADLYIAHYVAALPAAAKAAQRYGTLYAFDAEDFHLGVLSDSPENVPEKETVRAIERRYLPGAAYVTAASPLIAEAYAESYGITLPTTILNVFPKRNAPPASSPGGTAQPGPSLYWFSQTIGPGRGLETAVEAISRAASKPHLYLRGIAAPGYRERLCGLALKAGIADRLHFLEAAAPDELERLGSAYDLGFIGELPETINRRIALTNKLFSYILGGLPILASNIPAHSAIAPDFGPAMGLYAVHDPLSLASAIDAILLDPARLAEARAHAWRLGQDQHNWDREQTRFLETVRVALNTESSAL